jgi:hypothetical protein
MLRPWLQHGDVCVLGDWRRRPHKKSRETLELSLTTITTEVDNCSPTGLQVLATGRNCLVCVAAPQLLAVWYPFWGELVPEWTALMGNQEALLMPSGSDSNNLLSKFLCKAFVC